MTDDIVHPDALNGHPESECLGATFSSTTDESASGSRQTHELRVDSRPLLPGPLSGLRVIEYADEMAEHCGLLLMGLGAEVIKVEPPAGSATRHIGPFVKDRRDLESSLYFWQYNRNKRSVVLDPSLSRDRDQFSQLIASADILLQSVSDTNPDPFPEQPTDICTRLPHLILARMTHFGDGGPWATYKATDLVHQALGGVTMNCGYDPQPPGEYDTPPIAPQMWHAYHVASEQLAIGILGALVYRLHSGRGQYLSLSVHEAVSKSTELDLMNWIFLRAPLFRQTCRHATLQPNYLRTICDTKDGRFVMTFPPASAENTLRFVQSYGLDPAPYESPVSDFPSTDGETATAGRRAIPGTGPTAVRAHDFAQRLVRAFRYDSVPWEEAQRAGLMWAPLRQPHENLFDPHWRERRTYQQVLHDSEGIACTYPVSKWLSDKTQWITGRAAPHLGEHTTALLSDLPREPAIPSAGLPQTRTNTLSAIGKPFALDEVRILDFGWFLASAGGTRFLNALGAQSIKVEWSGHPDTRSGANAPQGGRVAREGATAPLTPVDDPDMGGQFNNKNPGKLGIALNAAHPTGLAILKELVKVCDIVADGFAPGVMERWGLGYETLCDLNPKIIYCQQSGMGSHGRYHHIRTFGPLAASLSGLSEMSGFPSPNPPAGWGYSYLDWIGAYTFAQAMLAALYFRDLTGQGQYIDGAQVESGLYLCGTSLLDWQVNGHAYRRTGNREINTSAPSGIYRCLGPDSWIALSCSNDTEWSNLARLIGDCRLTEQRFDTFSGRLAAHDELDQLIEFWTCTQDRYLLMETLQAVNVPAGVCQTAEDRVDRDPQLRWLDWLTELRSTKLGAWPVAGFPVLLSETPAYIGGRTNRGAPCYGEDNESVLIDLLGMSAAEVADLYREGVVAPMTT